MFYHSNSKQSIVVTDMALLFWGRFWKYVELWVEKAIEHSMRNTLFCRSLEGKTIERNDGGLAGEVSEASKGSGRAVCDGFGLGIVVLVICGF